MADVRLIDANALNTSVALYAAENAYLNDTPLDILRMMSRWIAEAHTIDAVPVVRCMECKNGAPLPEEARDEFSPGVMRCLAGRGDCDKYCTTWEDGFCDEGAKMDAKDMDVPTKDGGAEG